MYDHKDNTQVNTLEENFCIVLIIPVRPQWQRTQTRENLYIALIIAVRPHC